MMKYFSAFLMFILFAGVSSCQGKREYVNPEPVSVMKATVNGREWQASDAILKVNTLNGSTILEGWQMHAYQVGSSIHIQLPDSQLRVGKYPVEVNLLKPAYYEDTFQKCWNTTSDYTFEITRIENDCVWGTFSFTGTDSLATGGAKTKTITKGTFENVKIERVQ